ncbi:MAG: type II toxin-antitoxin system VapC family toxin [Kiritimatiellaceae bacterium]|nr:type II toxin-antitoxin system VapC family toxin [Kiritimatiellaceae bacterium]
MKSIVIDTSALIAVVANEPEKRKLVSLTDNCLLIAPHSVYWEVGNAFSAMIKRERTTLQKVNSALRVFDTIPIRYVDVRLEDALELSQQHGIYAYDAYLLATALRHSAPLLSLDRQMVHLGEMLGIHVLEV